MLLYHFTAEEYLDSILVSGLVRGELPLNQPEALNAISLTSDKSPSGHGLTDGQSLSEAEKSFFRQEGKQVPDNARFPNKRAVRITVKVPKSSVKKWLPWARRRLESSWLNTLIDIGGGYRKAKTWWFSPGAIPPGYFVKVERADGAGGWVEVAQWEGA